MLLPAGAARVPGLLLVRELRGGGGDLRRPGPAPAHRVAAGAARRRAAAVVVGRGRRRGELRRARGPADVVAVDAREGLHPPRGGIAVGRWAPARAAPRHGLVPVKLPREVVRALTCIRRVME